MTDFGSGLHLNSTEDTGYVWDLDVDETGDIRTVSGMDELQKDLAFTAAIELEEYRGEPTNPTVLNRIHGVVIDILEQEVRIDNIVNVDVVETDISNRIKISALVESNNEDIELVITEDL